MASTAIELSPLLDLVFDDDLSGRCLVAPDGTVLRVNAEWLRSTGLALEDVLGADIIGLFPETRDMALALHARARAGHRVEVPRHVQRVQGREVYWEGRIAPVPMERGTGLLISAREVTPEPASGSGAAPSRELLAKVVEQSRTCIAVVAGRELRYTLVNPAYQAISPGVPMLGRTYDEVFPEAAASGSRVRFLQVLDTGEAWEVERWRAPIPGKPDATWRGLVTRLPPVPFEPPSALVVIEDITAQTRAEDALDRSCPVEDLHRAVERYERQVRLFEGVASTTPDFVYLFDLQGRFLYANRRLLEIWGMSLPDVVGKTCRELGYEQWHHDMHMREIAQVIATRRPIKGEVPFTAPRTGIHGIYEYIFTPVLGPDGAVETVAGTTREVTDRRRAEEALRASEERLALSLEASQVGIWEYDPATQQVDASPISRALVGIPSEVPATYPLFLDTVYPEDREMVRQATATALDPRGDGRYAAQYRVVRPDGSVRWISALGRVEFGEQAGARRATRMLGTMTDVTKDKQAELALREADRRKTHFLAVLSHELRNPLAPIRNSLVVLDHAPAGSPAAQRAREVLHRQTQQLSRLVDDLLDVSRIAHDKIVLRIERLEARELVRRAVADVRPLFEQRDVQLGLSEPADPVYVDADAARLAQMIGNLLHNALKFTGPGGHVQLRLVRRRDRCELMVRDDGQGIDPADVERIFDPFVQTARPGGESGLGLGLGLALVKDLAAMHGGGVRAFSEGMGKGAEFVVDLPLVPSPAAAAAQARLPERSAGLEVLIVEDNEDAATTLADLLSLTGSRASAVYTGRAGLDQVLARRPDVVICDVGLPDMSGHDVIREIRATDPDRRTFAIALTGYAQPRDREEALAAGFDAHLPKPPPFEELQALLAAASRRKAERPGVG